MYLIQWWVQTDLQNGTIQDMEIIARLDMGESLFFSHNDPEIVNWMVTRKLDI